MAEHKYMADLDQRLLRYEACANVHTVNKARHYLWSKPSLHPLIEKALKTGDWKEVRDAMRRCW